MPSYPVSSAQILLQYDGSTITYGRGLRVKMNTKYIPIQVFGDIFAKGFVINYVQVVGTFEVAETRDESMLQKHLDDIDASLLSSGPSNKQFNIIPLNEFSDAPTYIIKDIKITDFEPSCMVGGDLMAAQVSFIGRKMVLGP